MGQGEEDGEDKEQRFFHDALLSLGRFADGDRYITR
jgi:hypothetical protein